MAIYFFYGEEDFNIDLEIGSMKSKLNQDFLALNFQTMDNPNYAELINLLRTPPMMFGNMLIVINADKYFLSQKNFFEDNELDDIENALLNNPESLDIVFVVKLPRDDGKKLDSRRKLYKILSKFNTREFAPYKTYKTAEIAQWIKNHAKKNIGLTINDDATSLMIEQIGNNLRQFDIELNKLKLLAYPENIITLKMVEEIVISNQDLFNITEFIIKNQKDKALLEFKKLIDKKHPLEILAALQTMLRKWIILKTNSSSSTLELSKLTGMHEYVVKQTLAKLKQTKASDLINLKQNLFNVECKLKTADSLDIVSEVEIALIR
jgi:DNA polymerase-3 subunit delta